MIYSFKTRSPHEVDLPDHLLTVGEGFDTFTITTADIEGLKSRLALDGVHVLECNRLDDLEPVTPSPDLLSASAELQGIFNNQLAEGRAVANAGSPEGDKDEQDLP